MIAASDYSLYSEVAARVLEFRENGTSVLLKSQRHAGYTIKMGASLDKSRVYTLSQL